MKRPLVASLFLCTHFLSATPPAAPQGVIPLFDAATAREPATQEQTPEALITRFADRARDRHAREAQFHSYDHYLSFYWEERTIGIEIIDRVAKGGKDITVNYDTLAELGAPEFRAFFRGINTPAEYHYNKLAPMVAPNRYSVTITSNVTEKRPLRVGDMVEMEVSQFLKAVKNGRKNYYGTTVLYVVGKGIVPWHGVGERLDSAPLPENAWLGGLTTLPYQYSNEPQHRFKQMAGNVAPISAQAFMQGRRLHHTDFATGEHSEKENPAHAGHAGKLGPGFVAKSCVACHGNNGRALPPAPGAAMPQTVVKTGADAAGAPHPALGSALQSRATSGPAEGVATLAEWKTLEGSYGDGTPYTLRAPVYAWKDAPQGTAPAFYSVRLSPQLVGLGLLEAVAESDVLALSDPADSNRDGISGRPHVVRDPQTGQPRLGRFGYKAGQARLGHQIAHALNSDMGVTTSVFPVLDGGTSAEGPGPASAALHSPAPEVDDTSLSHLTRYIALLGVSARRDLTDATALRGEQLFTRAGCASCHTPQLVTSPHHPFAELRAQRIQPYTDLLLHDLGPGLADPMGEGQATGSEWRTPPLWSIGLTAGVSGGEAYLHDGRARTLEESILWHGGEAERAKETFRTLPAPDRAALVQFLKSL